MTRADSTDVSAKPSTLAPVGSWRSLSRDVSVIP